MFGIEIFFINASFEILLLDKFKLVRSFADHFPNAFNCSLEILFPLNEILDSLFH